MRAVRGFIAAALWLAVGLAILLSLPSAAAAERYVAMGDSYSAGTGSRVQDWDSDADCDRSSKAFGPQIRGDLGAASSFRFVACSGAKIPHVLTSVQGANPVQASVLGADTLDVTISIGGNDAGFSSTLIQCGLPLVNCDGDIDGSQDYIRNTLPGQLDRVLDRIRTSAPNARIGLVGYPRLFPANGDDCSALTFFSAGEIARLNQTADLMADVARDRARAHGAAFIDARAPFLGHAWCEDEWINGLSNPTTNSYHPNLSGHAAYTGITRAAMLATPDRGFTRGASGRIAFASDRDGNSEIYVINGDGSFPINLTGNPTEDRDPVFSPDGTRIAFASNRTGRFEIYTMDSTGETVTQLTRSTGSTENLEPDFSPNGRKILFRSSRDGNNEIYSMYADGTGQIRLTNNPASDFAPSFSPDGAEIVFQRHTAGTGRGQGNEVFRMSSDGQGQVNLTDNAASVSDGAPAFSPDGSRIVFHSNRDGAFGIYTLPVEGGAATRVATGPGNSRSPVFSPDGSQIAFESDRDGSPQIYTVPATGSGAVRRTIGSANESSPDWQADSRPPETTITDSPPALSNNQTPSFGFDSDEPGSTFECRIDDRPFAGCSSPWTAPPLDDGDHVFAVRARDPAGNLEPDPVTYGFTVDTAGKLSRITAGPSGPTTNPSPVFEFESDDPDVILTFECRFGPAGDSTPDWEGCESPFTPGELADGEWRFEVKGTDPVGNPEPDPQVRSFTVDTVAPTTTITQAPPAAGIDRNPAIAFLADEPGADFECRVAASDADDPGNWTSCDSPHRPGPLEDGEWRFEVRATDAAGNLEATPASTEFTIDTKAPRTVIDTAPGEQHPDAEATFTFTGDEPGLRFECRLDPAGGSEWAACDAPRTYSGLHHGGHEFQVRAIDPAGNVEDPPVDHRFGVKTDPNLRILSVPSGVVSDRHPEIKFAADDPDMQFECRFGPAEAAGEWRPCDSPFQPAGTEEALDDGEYSFQVRGTDWFNLPLLDPGLPGGGSSAEKVTLPARSWTVATGPPAAKFTEVPAKLSNSRTARFLVSTGPGTDRLECQLDGGTWQPCTPESSGRLREVAVTGLFDGEHELRVRARGPLGTGPESSYGWTVDATPPEVQINRAPARRVASADSIWEFSGRGGHSGLVCRLDQREPEACESPFEIQGLADGEHRFEVFAVDVAGNRSPLASRTWEIDTTGPVVRITGSPNQMTAARSVAFSFEADDPKAVFSCRQDDGPWISCSSPLSRRAGLGQHAFEVKAIDDLGNESATETRHWRTVGPRLTLKSKVRLNRRGRAVVGRAACRGDLPCTIKVSGRVALRAGKLRVRARIAGPRKLAPGTATKLRLVAGKAGVKRLRKRPARARIRVSVKPQGAPAATVVRRVTARL